MGYKTYETNSAFQPELHNYHEYHYNATWTKHHAANPFFIRGTTTSLGKVQSAARRISDNRPRLLRHNESNSLRLPATRSCLAFPIKLKNLGR